MFVLEYRVQPKITQIRAVNEAIRTVKFVRNKALRYWMDNKANNGKAAMYRFSTLLRKEFKFVEQLNSSACQVAVERTLAAINRFYDNCKKKVKGKKGYPRFQKNNRSVEYKVSGWKLSENRKHITFTDKKGIGTLKLIGSRDLNYYQPSQIKRVRILKRADGYYVQFCVALDPRDTVKQLEPTKRTIGLDVGLNYFYADSNGNVVDNPRFYRKAEKKLNRLNRRKSKKWSKGKPQSQNYLKARKRYARAHLRVSRQRRGFVEREALRVIQSNDLIPQGSATRRAYEDLNIRGLVKSKLAKSINDAAWGAFREWLEYFGYKYGRVTVAVPPHYTSQNCSNCGEKVQKSLSTRTHICPHCGYCADRDVNAAINILSKGLSTAGHAGSKACGEDTSTLVGHVLKRASILCESRIPYPLGRGVSKKAYELDVARQNIGESLDSIEPYRQQDSSSVLEL